MQLSACQIADSKLAPADCESCSTPVSPLSLRAYPEEQTSNGRRLLVGAISWEGVQMMWFLRKKKFTFCNVYLGKPGDLGKFLGVAANSDSTVS